MDDPRQESTRTPDRGLLDLRLDFRIAATPEPAQEPAPRGAYGLKLEGVDEAAHLLVTAASDWPTLRLERREGGGGSDQTGDALSTSSARLILQGGGTIELERNPGRAVITTPTLVTGPAVVHPYLAPIAAVLAHWYGRESMHAAAIVVDGGAWGLLGSRGSGKSTLAAWFALRRVPVLCDDMLVVERGVAYAGPRALDLREGAAARLGVGEPLGVVGARKRWRLELPPLEPAVPLRGWVFLGWGHEAEVRRVGPSERLRTLAAHRGLTVAPGNPELLLELAALPAVSFRRSQEWDDIESSSARLLAALAGEA